MATQHVFGGGTDVVWQPGQHDIERSRLSKFMHAQGASSIDELHRRAIDDPEWFWRAVVADLDVQFRRPFSRVLDLSRGKPFPRWFVDGGVNVAYNCLDKHVAAGRGDKPAIHWEGDDGSQRTLTFQELMQQTAAFAGALRSIGVQVGDRVGLFMSLVPETAVAFLACARIGAVVIPMFSGYGPDPVASRLKDGDVRILLTADGFFRRGKLVPMKDTADEALSQAPGVERMLVLRRAGNDVAMTPGRDVYWDDLLESGSGDTEVADTNADDVLIVMYTSGTTGKPKGIVHTHGGFLANIGRDMGYAFDVQEDDTVFWITDFGWLVGPMLTVGGLSLGATIVFYEGVPDYPNPGRLWEIAERYRATLLGIAPTAARTLMAQGDQWVEGRDLSSLRAFGTTGEPWNPEPWNWLFGVVGQGRIPILNYAGGTEMGGGILCCYPILPLKPCSFAGPVVGIDADVVNEQGEPVRGEVGELVVRNVSPGMTKSFWRDDERYLETYWSRIPDIWVHGDLAWIDDDGFWYIPGRSDDTIKVAGKRVGPAEFESILVGHPFVQEAAAIGVPDPVKGQTVVCFVVPVPGQQPSEGLKRELLDRVGAAMGKALAPKELYFVSDLPKTRNAKIMRRVIKARYLGTAAGDLSSLENPDAVDLLPTAAGG